MDMTEQRNNRAGSNPARLGGIVLFALLIFIGGWLVSQLVPISLPPQASAEAQNVDSLFTVLMLLGGIIFFLVQGLLVYSVIRFRARPNDTSDGPSIHGNTTLEIVWTIIPSIIVVVLAVLSFIVWNTNTTPKPNENFVNGQPVPVSAVGQRFAWTFNYETGQQDVNGEDIVISTNEMHTYVGQNVALDMTTNDVIHSFWVPAMRVKQDLLPGRETTVRFTPIATDAGFEYTTLAGPLSVRAEPAAAADVQLEIAEGQRVQARLLEQEEGSEWANVELLASGVSGWVPADALGGMFNRYRLICTELCGGGHGEMYSWLVVHENEESFLENWYNPTVETLRTPPEDPVERAPIVLEGYPCANCHVLDSLGWAGITGPSLEGLADRAASRAEAAGVGSAVEYIVQSIRQPNAYLVPGYDSGLMPYFGPEEEPIEGQAPYTYMPQDDLIAIVGYLCTETASGDPADSTCDLDFEDPEAVNATLQEITDLYE